MKVTLAAGIKSISGSVKQRNGSLLVFKTFNKPAVGRKPGETETRAYFMPKRVRATPPSEKELAVRQRFAKAALYFQTLSDEQRKQYFDEWVRSNLFFNGKWYATLRGYIMARYYAEHPVDE